MANEVKVETGKKKFYSKTYHPNRRTPATVEEVPYKAGTVGLQEYVFTVGRAQDAVRFEEVKKKLAQYAAISIAKIGASDLQKAIDELVTPVFTIPTLQPAGAIATPVENEMWKLDYQEYHKRKVAWDENKAKAFQLVLAHCHPHVEDKIKTSTDWDNIKDDNDVIGLLTTIRSIVHMHDETKQGTMAIVEQFLTLLSIFQKPGESPSDYYRAFNAQVDVIEIHGGSPGYHVGLNKTFLEKECKKQGISSPANASAAVRLTATKRAKEAFLAALMLRMSDAGRYDYLKENIDNQFLHGNDVCPETREEVLKLLLSYSSKSIHRHSNQKSSEQHTSNHPGVAFPQVGRIKNEKRDHSQDKCYNCNKIGHHANECPDYNPRKSESGMVQISINEPNDVEDLIDLSDEQVANESEFDEAAITEYLNDYGVGFLSVNANDTEHDSVILATTSRTKCNQFRIYLDSCATQHSACNMDILSRIHRVPIKLHQNCNAGVNDCDKMGFLGGIKFWCNPDGIANLLSIPQLEIDGYKVEYNTDGEWLVHSPNGATLHFKRDNSSMCHRMPYIEVTGNTTGFAFVQTVRGNYEGFSKPQVQAAITARKVQAMLGHPPDTEFIKLVRQKLIPNCPVKECDIANASSLFGPDRSGLRGRTVRQTPSRVEPQFATIPRDMFAAHKFVVLVADVMFVNGVPFLVTLARDIRFRTCAVLPNRSAKQLASSLNLVIDIYRRGGFEIRAILMDMEFEPLTNKLGTTLINTTAAREHVGEVERDIRLVKERCRALISDLPFKILPLPILIELIYFAVFWLNAIPANNGISSIYSPREIVTGLSIDFHKHCRVEFGTYVEASRDAIITNTMTSRTEECIALGPANNLNGSLKCFNLATGKVVRRRTFHSLPMPDRIIRKVEAWGTKSKQAAYRSKLSFLNRLQRQFDWDVDDCDEPIGLLIDPLPDLAAEFPGIPLVSDNVPTAISESRPLDPLAAAASAAVHNANLPITSGPGEITGVLTDDGYDYVLDAPQNDTVLAELDPALVDAVIAELDPTINNTLVPVQTTVDESDDESESDDDEDEDDHQDNIADILPTRLRRSQRIRKQKPPLTIDFEGRGYALKDGSLHINTTVEPSISTDLDPIPIEDRDSTITYITGVILTQQYNVRQGLKLFGQKGEQAVSKELQQLHDLETYRPVDPTSLTAKERHDAITSLMFLTEKRCGRIKARACADGRKQRSYINKEDATSPTVSTDSVFITSAIEAHENRNVVTLDIPGAFLHADTDEDIIMLFKGPLAEILERLDPKLYRKHIMTTQKGEKLLYVKVQKAIYGLMRSALLFYLKLVKELQDFGFRINPYDPCVANKIIDGTQMTLTWHVDDLKVSHVNNSRITELILYLAKIYGNKITINRGTVHDYLGMDLDYSLPGVVRVSMIKYVQKIIDGFPEVINKSSATPGSDYLFTIRENHDDILLNDDQAQVFHHIVAQLLFVAMRARRDIQTAVAFLTTRVKQPDEDDWGKLRRVIKYLYGTKNLKLTLSVDNVSLIQWYVDASYNIHNDCRGQSGAMMTLGKGAVISFSKKQKLNVKSSTEGELVGIDDALPLILWTRYFIEAQGYTIEENILFQDNKSTILLANNGKWSSSKRTKHIKARYFFIKDKVDKGDVTIRYKPTDLMISDVNTKPLQGTKFYKLRSELMNCELIYDDELELAATHPDCLPISEGLMIPERTMLPRVRIFPRQHCRSVLELSEARLNTRLLEKQEKTIPYVETIQIDRGINKTFKKVIQPSTISGYQTFGHQKSVKHQDYRPSKYVKTLRWREPVSE